MSVSDPHVVITLGDPAGIGPEVVQGALLNFASQRRPTRVTLCGPRGVADVMAQRLAPVFASAGFAAPQARCGVHFGGPLGEPSAASGQAALDALMDAIALAQDGACDAIVTAPLSKQALAMAGSQDRGHTEILARELGVGPVAMAFYAERLKVVLATVHVPLRDIWRHLSMARVVEVAHLLHQALLHHGGQPGAQAKSPPRLALAGLNPHAGETGLMGREEIDMLQPAAALARASGVDLSDPVPADTVFLRASTGEFDGVVALYHDQGLIPVKLLSFGAAVNVTLGLQVVRTSPDHGTAYDRVGTGTARCDGFLQALHAAFAFI